MDLITFENHVPAQQGAKRVLGKKMCVPFGKILRDVVVPNTVTKAIYTEKVYTIVDLYGDAVTSFIFMGAVIAVFIKILLKVCV